MLPIIILISIGLLFLVAFIIAKNCLYCPKCHDVKLVSFFRETTKSELFSGSEYRDGKILTWKCPQCNEFYNNFEIKFKGIKKEK